MLETLHRIVQSVNAASDFREALEIIVDRVAEATDGDVCSVYLLEGDGAHLQLMATRGLNADAVGRVRLPLDEGLVGLVAQREESINLNDADRHPRFRYFPETGEERFHSFLGVPIIHYQSRLGVLVVQRQARDRFTDAEVAFLVTMAAQLAGVMAHARVRGELTDGAGAAENGPLGLDGIGGSSGLAIGEGYVMTGAASLESISDRRVRDIAAEEAAFASALEAARDDLRALAARMEGQVPAAEQQLFDVYLQMLDGDSLRQRVHAHIRDGHWAPFAVRLTIAEHARRFEAMDDAYLRERASDLRDVGRRLLTRLLALEEADQPLPEQTILVGEEVSASQLVEIPTERLAGVVSAGGSANSHIAILARALGVPAVMGVRELPVHGLHGRALIVDGYRGRVEVDPAPGLRDEYQRLVREEEELTAELAEIAGEPAQTPDGHCINLYVNTGLAAEIERALEIGCAGVGLHRTEFPFMVSTRFPGESEQADDYRQVLEAFAPLPVTLRTLDVGGDKPLPYFPTHDENPFLGWRGVRMTLDHPEIFLTQLRAMLRASAGLENLRIMFPMITRVEEADQAAALVRRARDELADEGIDTAMPALGAMVEVPAAVYQAESLARRLDFLSIGSNDLAQYLLAVDRNNSRVASIYDELHPAVLRAVAEVAATGQRLGTPVTICGSMAGEPAVAPLLLAMGMEGLSMSSGRLLRVKRVLRTIPYSAARSLLDSVLVCETPGEVRQRVNAEMDRHGLGGLIRAGR
ncbi:phosphoenolpyruvate--protein phosphotransferase [Spiribacter vilamensis]|uniref:phosphoenolpyruvate--protein phosphotransferase n=1 Tax=Spiribacter vilamensis TaxID=531306 RepID=A0A4Q8D2Z8_9GAMM|nr:phosphoenolpyruvate--protein phosphotransferase [Spiribacter vilamensis]RZU99707.1 phosphotransferase system enzyme I (PtsP) [Spiribacter vilamensis]TVO61346.1 phosphoenolpyruvate--protein phosphotransferase [Spiribacter vilamensis]